MKRASRTLVLAILVLAAPALAEEYLFGVEGTYLTQVKPRGGAVLTVRGYRDLPVSLRLRYRLYDPADGGTQFYLDALYDDRRYPTGFYSGLGLGYAFGRGTVVVGAVMGVRYSPFQLPGEVYLEWTPSFPDLTDYDLVVGLNLRLFARGL